MNSIRIERAENGYVVCMDDPAIVAKNRKSDGGPQPYVDPERQYVFDDVAGVVAFLTKNLDKIAPSKDDYASSFDAAIKEDDEEDEDE
jgi:hypothetical protein